MQQVIERVPIMLRVKKDLKVSAMARARLMRRSINNYLEFLIVQDCARDLPEEPIIESGEIDIGFE
jgi:hypothetical protein